MSGQTPVPNVMRLITDKIIELACAKRLLSSFTGFKVGGLSNSQCVNERRKKCIVGHAFII